MIKSVVKGSIVYYTDVIELTTALSSSVKSSTTLLVLGGWLETIIFPLGSPTVFGLRGLSTDPPVVVVADSLSAVNMK